MGLRQKLLSQSSVIFAVRIAGAGVQFACQVMIAKLWGAGQLGTYLLAIAAANLLALTLPLGFQTIGAYFAADYAARGDGRSLRAFMLRAYGHIAFPGLAIVALGFGAAAVLGGEDVRVLHLWPSISMLAVASAVVYVNGAVLVGLNRPYAGFFADALFRPLVIVALFAGVAGAAAVNGTSSDGANVATFLRLLGFAYLAIAAMHTVLAVRAARTVPAAAPAPRKAQAPRWWRLAVPWAVMTLATEFYFDLDLLLLSTYLPPESIAVFGVCTRILVLVSFGIAAVYTLSVPNLMQAQAHDDPEEVMARVGDANLTATAFSCVLVVAVGIGGPFVLALFGPGFEAGALPLAIMSLVLIARAVFGPTSIILSTHERAYANLPAVFAGLGLLALGNLVLVPPYGLTGAALAALVSLGAGYWMLWRTALRVTGLDVSIFPALVAFARRRRA